MAKCSECICYEKCQYDGEDILGISCDNKAENECRYFKHKSRFVELPCDIGTKVYWINNGEVYTTNFGICDVMYFGNSIFLTREKAENALKEMGK